MEQETDRLTLFLESHPMVRTPVSVIRIDLEHHVVEIDVSSASLAQEGLRNHGILEHANIEFITTQEDIGVPAVKQAGKFSNDGIIERHTTVVT